ncbi:MAG TPA: ABC transporter substrate-binding protein [Gemmatimonadales bacterium]|nr:ABC transporter substrate-binding protein [Gemmatimonadales bacterium]
MLIALGSAACAGSSGTITIAVSGDVKEASGVSMHQAADLAVSQINARGGIGGRHLEVRFLPDSGDPNVAVRIARRLVDDAAVVAVVGHVTSGITQAAMGVYGSGRNPLPVVSPTASSPDLSGVSPYFFRTCPTDLSHGPALARFARNTLHAARVAVLFENDDYGRGMKRAFSREFRQLGGTVVSEDPFFATTATLEPYLARISKAGGVDVLVVAADPEGGALALKDLRRLGDRVPVIGGDGLAGVEAETVLAEGTRISLSYLADRPGAANANFVAAYARANHGQRPDDTGAETYDAVNLLAKAIEQVGADRGAIRDYLAQVGRGRPAYEGVTGTVAFDSLGDVPAKTVVIGVAHAGHLELDRTR